MIVVIQCAASKRSDAGHLKTAHGIPVKFVAAAQIRADESAAAEHDTRGFLLQLADFQLDGRHEDFRLTPP
jgi:hypothetical protein